MTERKCENCEFNGGPYEYIDRHPPEMGLKCRRKAPTVTGGQMSALVTAWPLVAADDWCAEFRARASTERGEG